MSGNIHDVDGETVLVRRNRRPRRNAAIFREGGSLVLELPPGVPLADEGDWARRMVQRLQAREHRSRRGQTDAALMARALALRSTYLLPLEPGMPQPRSVTWSARQGRRWGSCTSADRTIRLSHRLQDFPQWVADYVLLHELAHLIETSHGPRFWALLRNYPRLAEAQGYLRGYSAGVAARSAEPVAGEVDEDGD